jgi:hypothetical protein
VHPSCQTLGVMQAASFQVENQTWLKVVIISGTLLFASMAVGFAWQAYAASPLVSRVIQLAVALASVWLVTVGVHLIKFMNYTLEVEESSVTIQTPKGNRIMNWADIRLLDRSSVQVTEIRDRDERLLFAVDWYAKNARRFVQVYCQKTDNDA